jgi:hypothetical protein
LHSAPPGQPQIVYEVIAKCIMAARTPAAMPMPMPINPPENPESRWRVSEHRGREIYIAHFQMKTLKHVRSGLNQSVFWKRVALFAGVEMVEQQRPAAFSALRAF